MRKVSSIGDFFVICSVPSDRRAKAITDNITEKLEEKNVPVLRTDGYKHGLWTVVDCGDVIAHVFRKDLRDFYKLEKLWADVPQKRIE